MAPGADRGGGSNGNGAPVEARKAVMSVRRKKKKKSKSSEQANGRSSSSTAASTMAATSALPVDGDGQQQLQKQQKQLGGKKERLVWTTELHDKFVEAYNQLGEDAVPKKILGAMNVDDVVITRSQVASHLQKYRNKLKLKELGIPERGNRSAQEPLHASASPPAASPSLHPPPPPPQAPLADPGTSQQQIGHAQLFQAPLNCFSGSNVATNLLLHPHPGVPMAQPIQHCFATPVKAAVATRWKLAEQQEAERAAMMQRAYAAAAASGRDPMLVGNYILGVPQTVGRAPAAPNHRREPHAARASQAVIMGGECSVREAIVRCEQTATLMAQLQIAGTAEEGQEGAAGPEPALAGSLSPPVSNSLERFWPSYDPFDFGFPHNY